MSWFDKIVKKNISRSGKKNIPDNLWVPCNSCKTNLFIRELEKNMHVCPNCGYHMFRPLNDRLSDIFDDGKYILIDIPEGLSDPLKFKDKVKYSDRIENHRKKTGEKDAIKAVYGKINGVYAVAAFFNFNFMGGSMGTSVGEGLIKAMNYAIEKELPFVIFTASGGARMQEGIMSLMQMARVTIAVDGIKKAGLPYIVVFTNPTTGGVSASFAMIGDIHIAEAGAIIGFAGARVIEQTIKTKLPDGFQTAEYLEEHGMLDMVVNRKDLKGRLSLILKLLTKQTI